MPLAVWLNFSQADTITEQLLCIIACDHLVCLSPRQTSVPVLKAARAIVLRQRALWGCGGRCLSLTNGLIPVESHLNLQLCKYAIEPIFTMCFAKMSILYVISCIRSYQGRHFWGQGAFPPEFVEEKMRNCTMSLPLNYTCLNSYSAYSDSLACLVVSSTILDPRFGRFMDKSTPLSSVFRLLQ